MHDERNSRGTRRDISSKEKSYLDNLVRGVYAKGAVPSGTMIDQGNFDEYFFLAVPLLKGQLSGREKLAGAILAKDIKPGEGYTYRISQMLIVHLELMRRKYWTEVAR